MLPYRTTRRFPTAPVAALVLTLAVGMCLSASGTAVAGDVDTSPTAYVTGDQTDMVDPAGVGLDAAGNRYVANTLSASVTVYAPGTAGNVPPTRTITGGNTGLIGPRAILVEPSGRIYVADGASSSWSVRIFAPGASGNVAPVAVIAGLNTGLGWIGGLALDAAGRLFVTDRSDNEILVYAPGVTGNSGPIRRITGPATALADPHGIAVDSRGLVHVANYGGSSVISYGPSAVDNAAPVRTISGPATGITEPVAVAVDSQDNLYVANVAGAGPGPDAIVAFAPTAAPGNSAPAQRLVGGSTDMTDPRGVALDAGHGLTVVTDTPALLTFAPLLPRAGAPGAISKLKVKGKKIDAKRTVTWKAPGSDGGASLVGYLVTVKKKAKTLITRTVTATKVVLKRKKLKNGRLTVTVVALNRIGPGPVVAKRFRVVK